PSIEVASTAQQGSDGGKFGSLGNSVERNQAKIVRRCVVGERVMSARRFADTVAAFAAALLAASCAVGPDFVTPDPPEADRYTKGRMPTRTESADVAGGQVQRFRRNLDVPGEWWRLFHSPALNALIARSIKANPTLDAAVAALRAAGENVQAQEGKWFPLVQGNFTASRQKTSAALAPVPSSNASVFSLYT